jgi:hypothetical protein
MNPERHFLDAIRWQFFATFTFKSVDISDAVKLKMLFATTRKLAKFHRIHFFKILWTFRYELGEKTRRPHFHALIAGVPDYFVDVHTAFQIQAFWRDSGGGHSQVRVYESNLPGVDYVLKGVDAAYTNVGANLYELSKFGGRCDVMLSMSLIRHVQNRARFGHRDRDGLFSGINGAVTPRSVKSHTGKPRRTDTNGNTLQGVVRERSSSRMFAAVA